MHLWSQTTVWVSGWSHRLKQFLRTTWIFYQYRSYYKSNRIRNLKKNVSINIHACIYSTSNDYVIVSPFLINCKDMALYTEWNYQFDLMSRWTKYTVPRWYLYVLQTLKTITIISKWEDFILKNLYSAHEDLQRPV